MNLAIPKTVLFGSMDTPKKTRRSRAELRQLLIDVGCEIVAEDGIGIAGSNITYKSVFDRLLLTQGIRVTGASVHERIWHSVEEFQLDILRESITDSPDIATPGALAPMLAAIERFQDDPESLDAGAVFFDALRESVLFDTTDPTIQTKWEEWLTVVAAYLGLRDVNRDAPIDGVITQNYQARAAAISSQSFEIYKIFGFHARASLFGPPTDQTLRKACDIVADTAIAAAEGVALRVNFDRERLVEIQLPTGEHGEQEQWSLSGLMLRSTIDYLMEPAY